MTSYGSQSDTEPIRAVILKRPAEAYGSQARIAAEW